MDIDTAVEVLEVIHSKAEKFVDEHYKPQDSKDRNIKILATMNQIIELRQKQ